jgi:hypothetical protein
MAPSGGFLGEHGVLFRRGAVLFVAEWLRPPSTEPF